MKKNLIALAVAGALVAPVAMAEVTVSGGLQAELVRINGEGSQPNGLYAADGFQVGKENSGNYGFLKFAASEDLGSNMKAIAVYNLNANVGDTDRGGLSQRDAYVGLSTGLGTILAGSLSTPYKSSTVGWDPMLATSFQARGNNGMSMLHNGYVSNAVAYANSFMGGMVKVVAAVVLDEKQKVNAWGNNEDNTKGKNAKSLSVNIAPMSGLDVAIAYIDASKFGDASVLGLGLPAMPLPDSDANATKIGVKYAMGPVTVAFQHEVLNKGLTVSGEKANVDFLTGTFKINDANAINLSVGKTSKKAGTIASVANQAAQVAVTLSDKDAKYAALDFNHAFSKNTSVYAGARVSYAGDNAVTTTVNFNTGAVVGVAGPANTMERAMGVGLRVNF